MVIEFRVLAVSKEKQSYDTDMLKGVFNADHPMLETVDTLQNVWYHKSCC